jgi:hypothetical protein
VRNHVKVARLKLSFEGKDQLQLSLFNLTFVQQKEKQRVLKFLRRPL